jgi:inosose dehydratase
MNRGYTRREFSGMVGLAGALPAIGAKSGTHRLKLGHTGITWGNDIDQAIADIASLGFYGFETFGNVLEAREATGGLGRVLSEHHLPLISGYCSTNLTDGTKAKDELEKSLRWARLIKSCGGSKFVLGPNSVPRQSFDFAASKATIIARLNETARTVSDADLIPVLHQHTGTCIEVRDEVYAVMDAADTKYLKFGPDVGQLAKGGSDPVKVVKDFLPLVRHMHLKDFSGGEHYLGYCPLGQGKVDIPAILDLMDHAGPSTTVMVELDPSPNMPLKAGETAKTAKDYLTRHGCMFRQL